MLKRIITIVLGVIIVAVVVVFMLLRQQQAARAESVYKIDSVKKSTLEDKVSTTGTLMSQNSFSQYVDVGAVTKVNIKLGDNVKKDDDICEVEVTSAATGVKTNVIKAEADGTVTQLNIKAGQNYNGVAPALVIEDLNSQKVQVKLSKNDSYKISSGQTATVKINDKEYSGTVDSVSPTATQITTPQGVESSLIVEVKLNQTIPDVKVGFDVDCDILLEELKDVLVVPLQSIVANPDASTHIFVVQDNKAKDKEVKLGLVQGSNVQILEGVSDGDRIILNPKPTLKDGDRVVEDTSK